MSMFVDALAFLGNLFAECIPSDSAIGKRRIELLVMLWRGSCVLVFSLASVMFGTRFVSSHHPLSSRLFVAQMSGISHGLLLGFTIQFILDGWDDAHVDCATDTEDVNGY